MSEQSLFKKYASIRNFYNMFQYVQRYHNDEYKQIMFQGTVKIHGSNTCVGYDFKTDTLFTQKRKSVLIEGDKFYGFQQFVKERELFFLEYFKEFEEKCDTVYLYGEFCGQGIQKKVGVSKLQKMFVAFDVAIATEGNERREHSMPDFEAIDGVYPINMFQTYTVDVDFSNVKDSYDELMKYTLEVEAECPVAKHFGVEGLGEGIVWIPIYVQNRDLVFKTKGDKHEEVERPEVSLAQLESQERLKAFANSVLTEARLQKGLEYLKMEEGLELNLQNTGKFIKYILNDVITEEALTIEEQNINGKSLNKVMGKKLAFWYKKTNMLN